MSVKFLDCEKVTQQQTNKQTNKQNQKKDDKTDRTEQDGTILKVGIIVVVAIIDIGGGPGGGVGGPGGGFGGPGGGFLAPVSVVACHYFYLF